MSDDRIERIRARAHAIWEREGRPEGRDAEHWRQATDEVDAEAAAANEAASDATEPKAPTRGRKRASPSEAAGTAAVGASLGSTETAKRASTPKKPAGEAAAPRKRKAAPKE